MSSPSGCGMTLAAERAEIRSAKRTRNITHVFLDANTRRASKPVRGIAPSISPRPRRDARRSLSGMRSRSAAASAAPASPSSRNSARKAQTPRSSDTTERRARCSPSSKGTLASVGGTAPQPGRCSVRDLHVATTLQTAATNVGRSRHDKSAPISPTSRTPATPRCQICLRVHRRCSPRR